MRLDTVVADLQLLVSSLITSCTADYSLLVLAILYLCLFHMGRGIFYYFPKQEKTEGQMHLISIFSSLDVYSLWVEYSVTLKGLVWGGRRLEWKCDGSCSLTLS
jgi:hypothetical protein